MNFISIEDELEKAITLHNKFRTEILEHSVEKHKFNIACMEWNIVGKYEEEQYTHCICLNRIRDCYVILNKINNIQLEPIGSSCIKHIINAGNKIIENELKWFENLDKIKNVETNKINTYCFNCLKKIRSNKQNREYVINYCKSCEDDNIINKTIILKEELCEEIQYDENKKNAINGNLTIYIKKYKKTFTFKQIYKKDKKYCEWIYNNKTLGKLDFYEFFMYYLDTKFTY